ncbi:MAG: site-specific integrase [Armatimonadetes bacterium]|nr:site-specific integrase [Armatimonadota bacterium]
MAGSLEKRGKSNWRLVYSDKGPTGRIKKTKTITTDQSCNEKNCKGCSKANRCAALGEAKKQLALFVNEIEKGQYIAPTKLTFSDFVERWLREYGEKNLAPKTLFRYQQILEGRVIPAIGHLKLEQIRPIHLMEFYNNLQKDGIREDGKPGGLSERTVLHHHRVISAVLQDAVEWQFIPANPAARVKPPKVRRKAAVCYDERQVGAMLEALETEELKYRVMVNMAVFLGCRRGELMGIEWAHVNFKEGTIRIEQASQYLPGKGVFTKPPKNESSVRVLSLPAFLVDMLKHYKKEQAAARLMAGDLWQGSDRLFTTWDGQAMHPDTISKWFPNFLKRHSLPPIPFHGLRHTAATMLINQGLPVKSVSGRLGHSDAGTTLNIYSHYLRSADREAAERLEQVYQGMAAKKTQRQ